MKRPNPLPPDHMTPAERRAELCAILALGLVRLRVKKASEELNHIFETLLKKVQEPGADSPFAEITDEDIDNLFGP